MDNSVLFSFIIQFLLAMGLANDHDRDTKGRQFLTLQYSIDILTPENVIGATFFTEDRLLVYSASVLVIVDLSNNTQPLYKYLADFQPLILAEGFGTELLLLSTGKHCIRHLYLDTVQINTFSGDCEQSGFVNGDKLNARYNNPTDLQRSGDYFYVADYYNDCVRRLWSNGYASKVISIHSRPFALGGDLYVAAHQTVYKVREAYNTYVQFIDSVNVTSLESCSTHALSMLSVDKCLNLLPLSRDSSLYPATINGSFDGLVCDGNITYVTQLMASSKPHSSTMQIYAVDTETATGGVTVSVPSTTAESSSTTTESYKTSRRTSAKDPKPIYTSTEMTSNQRNSTTKSVKIQTTDSVIKSTISSNELNSSKERVIVPLHNHAHDTFDHLPENYAESNGPLTVILPTVLAVVTVAAVLTALACIIYRRSSRHVSEVEPEDGNIDEADILLLTDPSSGLNPSTQYSNQNIHNAHRHSNASTGNGRVKHSLSNGHALNGTSFGNGVTLSEPNQQQLPTTRCHSTITDLTQL